MSGARRPALRWAALLAAALAAAPAAASLLAPLVADAAEPTAAWAPAPLPRQTLPATRFEAVTLDGARVLRVASPASYGNLVHPVADPQARRLAWRWRVERALVGTDLRAKRGDDVVLKVCALFEMPLERVPFVERQLLRVARATSGQALPAATLCYVWDSGLAAGTLVPNAHTRRVRFIVLQGADAPLARWRSESRDLHADFLRAFGDESATVPPLAAVLVGADSDNTGSAGLAHLADLTLQ